MEILKEFPRLKADPIFERARRKDAIFDDPPEAAMRLKEGLRIILRSAPKAAARDIDGVCRHALIPYPRLLKPVDWTEFGRVFEDLGDWLTRHEVRTPPLAHIGRGAVKKPALRTRSRTGF